MSVQTLPIKREARGSVVGTPDGAYGAASPHPPAHPPAHEPEGAFVALTELIAMAERDAVCEPFGASPAADHAAADETPSAVTNVPAHDAPPTAGMGGGKPPAVVAPPEATPATASAPAPADATASADNDAPEWGGTFMAVEHLLDEGHDAPPPLPDDSALTQTQPEAEAASATPASAADTPTLAEHADPPVDEDEGGEGEEAGEAAADDLDSLLWQNADDALGGAFESVASLTGEAESAPPQAPPADMPASPHGYVEPAADPPTQPPAPPVPAASAAPQKTPAAPAAAPTPASPPPAAHATAPNAPPAPAAVANPTRAINPAAAEPTPLRAALAAPRVTVAIADRSLRRLCQLVNGPMRRCPESWQATVAWVAVMLLAQGVGFTLWGVLHTGL